MRNDLSRLDLNKYKLFIVDWDGTLVDSSDSYSRLDKLFVENFYNIRDTSRLQELEYKCVSDDWRDRYYKSIDEIYADGNTPLDKIYRSVNKYKKVVQAQIKYIDSASVAMTKIRKYTDIKLCIATNSNTDDLEFFSSDEWPSLVYMNPRNTFDTILTLDEVKNPKPNSEMYERIIKHYNVDPKEVLVFDDDVKCLATAKRLGADTLLFSTKDPESTDDINFILDDWNIFIQRIVSSEVYEKAQGSRIDKPTIHDHYVWNGEWQDADYYELSDGMVPGIKWDGIYCFGNLGGKIPVVNYEHYPSGLPGGHIDPSDRNLDDALRREIKEELNCTVINWKPVGYKIIQKPDATIDYQLFAYAELEKDGEFSEDIGGLVHNYSLHDISEFSTKIEWNETSKWLQDSLASYYK